MKKILYFIRGVPTEAELAEAENIRALIRDCQAWHERDCFEECDIVMGKEENIPNPYKHLWQETNQQTKQSENMPENDPVPVKGRKSNRQEVSNSQA